MFDLPGLKKPVKFLRFCCLNTNSVLDINAWPTYTHAYLDFHLSHHIVLQKKPVYISHMPVGFTSEDAVFRQQKVTMSANQFVNIRFED